MNDPSKLMEDEINHLKQEEVFDLENLIVDGANARIHVEVDFPVYKDGELKHMTYGAIIRPLPSNTFTNATQIGLKNPDTDVNTEIVKAGLCTKDGEPFPSDLVGKLPVGVIIKLANKICEISGIEANQNEQERLVREVMGF